MRIHTSVLVAVLLTNLALCTLGIHWNCPTGKIENFDSANQRLVFRHTGNEIPASEFQRLYRTGYLDVAKMGCPGSQYRDPKLGFFWAETERVVMNIFDTHNKLAASVYFAFPQGDSYADRPQWGTFFEWQYLLNAEKQHYQDILTARHLNDVSVLNGRRRWYLASFHDGCPNDHIWFSILDNKGPCLWDKRYGKPSSGLDVTTIVYSPFETATQALTTLSVASKIELRLDGAFVTDRPLSGYRKVLRYPNAAGVDFLEFYENGTSTQPETPAQDPQDPFGIWRPVIDFIGYSPNSGDLPSEDTKLYRSGSFEDDVTGARSILVVVYDTLGNVAEALTFKGANHLKDWFRPENLISSLNWNLDLEKFNFFGVDGDPLWGRRMFINKAYLGCGLDSGFLVVSCLPPPDDKAPACDWEDFSGKKVENRKRKCAIFYTPDSDATTWNSYKFLIASAIEIFVK